MKSAFVAMTGLLSWLCLVDAFAFSPIPRDSAKALGVTKSRKPIGDGLVFVNGKFIAPPYVVERWGTGIRINGIQVTDQVIDWNDFLKTQDGVTFQTVASASTPSAALPPPPEPEPEPVEFEEVSCDLDALFNDDASTSRPKPSAKSKKARPRPKKKAATPKPPAPPVAVPVLTGKFVRNDAAKALLTKINDARTDIDRVLRNGGFICFGDGYSRLTGDRQSAEQLLARLPEIQQRAENVTELKGAVRSAGLAYLHDAVCDDLFKNRIDYRALKERRAKLADDREWKELLGPDGKNGR